MLLVRMDLISTSSSTASQARTRAVGGGNPNSVDMSAIGAFTGVAGGLARGRSIASRGLKRDGSVSASIGNASSLSAAKAKNSGHAAAGVMLGARSTIPGRGGAGGSAINGASRAARRVSDRRCLRVVARAGGAVNPKPTKNSHSKDSEPQNPLH